MVKSSRPGLVLEVDRRTPPVLFHYGEGFRLERLPSGSRIVYPPEPVEPLSHPEESIARALEEPHNADPLRAKLRPGMRLTIAFDDISLPLPPMRAPDARQLVLERVLTLAAEAGVDDVEIVAANSLHRRMTESEIRHMVGERVFRAFWPDRLRNFDAEDPDDIVFVGTTDQGEEVELCKRAMESDLLVYSNINLVAMDGGHKSVPVGFGTYRSLRHHHNVGTLLESKSYMHPEKSALHQSASRMGKFLADKLDIFTVETTLNNAAVSVALRLPAETGVRVVVPRPGHVPRRIRRTQADAGLDAPAAVPLDRSTSRDRQRAGRRDRGRARDDPRTPAQAAGRPGRRTGRRPHRW